MTEAEWVRIPVNITNEDDRRAITGVLAAYGLEVRIVRIKWTNRGTPCRYVEFRDTGLDTPQLITSNDGKMNKLEAANE